MSSVLWAQNSGRLHASLRVELSTSTVDIHHYATGKHTNWLQENTKEKAQDFEPLRQHVVRAMKYGGAPWKNRLCSQPLEMILWCVSALSQVQCSVRRCWRFVQFVRCSGGDGSCQLAGQCRPCTVSLSTLHQLIANRCLHNGEWRFRPGGGQVVKQ